MTPAERANLEYTYDKLMSLYNSGDIGKGELDQLYQIDDMLRSTWDAEAAQSEREAQPTIQSREPTVSEDVGDWWSDKLYRVSGDTPWPMSERESQSMGRKIAGLLDITPMIGGGMSAAQAKRDVGAGNYGDAAMNAIFGVLDVVPAMAATRSAARTARGAAPGKVGETAASVYSIGDRLAIPSGYRSISGKPSMVSIPDIGPVEARPVNPIEQAAKEYMNYRGMDASPLTSYPRQDPERGRLIAAAYDMMKDDPSNPVVRRAYDAMVQETLDQYNWLKNSGIEFKFLRDGMPDPYEKSPSMGYRDLVENGRLWVFPTEAGYGDQTGTGFFDASKNPLLRRVGRIGDKPDAVANDAFRAVHDAYGHFGPGNPFFRAPGEERAWIEHSRMYSPEARGAMTSETRGQNSWVNFGPFEEYNRTASGKDTRFADQKVGLLDPWAWEIEGMPSEQQLDMLRQNIEGWRR